MAPVINKSGTVFFLLILLVCKNSGGDSSLTEKTDPPVRSGTTLPEKKMLGVAFNASGIYAKANKQENTGKTAIGGGNVTWNYALTQNLGLFAKHELQGFFYNNIKILTAGHEAGFRYLRRFYSVEMTYLGHRALSEWLTDNGKTTKFSLGGVWDHGFETSVWGFLTVLDRLKLEGRMLFRIFRAYRGTMSTFGTQSRVTVKITGKLDVLFGLGILRVIRYSPRNNLERSTNNLFGNTRINYAFLKKMGLIISAKVTTSLFCGEVPMLELKRQVVDIPVVLFSAGFYFLI